MLFLPEELRTADTHHASPDSLSVCLCHSLFPAPTSVAVQLLSHARLFATPWNVACRASLSFTVFQSLFKFITTESLMPFNHLLSPSPPVLNFSQHQGLFQ